MSTAAAHIRRLDRSIARHGETITLQRLSTSPTTGAVTVVAEASNVPAFVRASTPQDLVASGVREISVVLSATGVASFGLPMKDDRIIVHSDPSNVEQVAPIYIGPTLVRVNMLCRG